MPSHCEQAAATTVDVVDDTYFTVAPDIPKRISDAVVNITATITIIPVRAIGVGAAPTSVVVAAPQCCRRSYSRCSCW